MYADVQKTRIALSNRIGRADLETVQFEAHMAALQRDEEMIGLDMRRAFRRVAPAEIIAWQKATVGIGEHLLARLLGAIGHPVYAMPYHWDGSGKDRILIADPPFPRRVSDLWSYCGHGDPSRRRQKGMSAEDAMAMGKTQAKTLVHLLAKACMTQRSSPYRAVYDKAREIYATREGWSDAHQHAAALRRVGKEILRDLWRVASGLPPHTT